MSALARVFFIATKRNPARSFVGQANSKKRNRAAFRDTRGSSTTPNNRRLQKNYGGSSYTMGRLALQKKLKSHRGCVNTLSFNSSGDKLVSGSDDCHIKIWDPHECTLIHSFHAQHSSNIFWYRPPFSLDKRRTFYPINCVNINAAQSFFRLQAMTRYLLCASIAVFEKKSDSLLPIRLCHARLMGKLGGTLLAPM